MFRQTTFGVSLSMLVIASNFMTVPFSGNDYSRTIAQTQKSHNNFSQAEIYSINLKNYRLEKLVFEQINQYRVSQGLAELKLNQKISHQARVHSQNMANGTVKFSHDGFARRIKSLPLKYNDAAENVAFNIGYNEPSRQAVIGWLSSPGHLKNIQGKYTLTGVGVATNTKGEVYLTQIFINTKK